MTLLSFSSPARAWLEALPLGDGRLGAMCWGGVEEARFDLNDGSAWSGSPRSEGRQPTVDAAEAARLFAEARSAVLEGRPAEADAPLMAMQSDYTQAYLPLATLFVRTDAVEAPGYERSLDLDSGVHEVTSGAVRQWSAVAALHGVLVTALEGVSRPAIEVTTPLRVLEERRAGNDLVLRLRLPSDVPPGHEPDFPAVTWSDDPENSVEAAVVVRVQQSAAGWVVWTATATTYDGPGRPLRSPDGLVEEATARIDAAAAVGAEQVLSDSAEDWRERMGRVRLRFDAPGGAGGAPARIHDAPTRIAAASSASGPLAADPALAAALFDYGRYLLLASSRPGGLPVTLQGLWNDSMQPPWSSNYTTNINLSMAYWPAFVTALPETAEPLLSFLAALARAGEPTARRLYGASGWVAHHNSDAWAYTSPAGARHGSPSWAFWPMAGPWLCRHLRDAVEFGALDDAAARDLAWPVVRGAALFALEWQHRLPDGSWGTAPSASPENTYRDATGAVASVAASTALDRQLLADLFATVRIVADAAGIDDDPVLGRVAGRLEELPDVLPRRVDGRILEWGADSDDVDPGHRHLSPLYAVYPGSEPLDDGRTAAVEALLASRGDESTGWSLAWKMALWARLRRGDRVAELTRYLLRPAGDAAGPYAGGLYPNLFAAHPPFQLDGNLGFTAALAECLLQSSRGEIDLLPALPAGLPDGEVTGLIARPGVAVDIAWSGGRLTAARLVAAAGRGEGEHTIRHGDARIRRTIRAGEDITLTAADFEGTTA